MSERDKLQQQDYSKFDTMTTDALEEILRLDAQLPEGETPDPDAILYIMEVLAKRERESENKDVPDVEAAWRTFNRYYRPCTGDDTSLYDDAVSDKTDPGETGKDIPDTSLTPAPRPGRRLRRAGFRTGIAAMIAVAVLAAGTATASAFGFDIWGAFAKWTGEIFGFQSSAEQGEHAVARQLTLLRHSMEDCGITENVLPSYLPEGYEVVNTKCQVEEEYVRFDCLLSDGEGSIILNYYVYLSNDFVHEFEKSLQEPEIYEHNGVKYYVMVNSDKYLAAWFIDNIECNIVGVNTREELLNIIDSIQKGE